MTTPGDQPDATAPAVETFREGRCHNCGYSLVGLPKTGSCPECGTRYDEASARRLQPWPSAFRVCLRLGWPIAGLVVAGFFARTPGSTPVAFALGCAMVGAVAVNSYFQVRSMLRRSLPEAVRTEGPVAILRGIGTTICVIILLAFVGAPLVLGVGCLIVLAGKM